MRPRYPLFDDRVGDGWGMGVLGVLGWGSGSGGSQILNKDSVASQHKKIILIIPRYKFNWISML